MHRFHAPTEACQQEQVRLGGAEARHATQVLRLRAGDAATVLDGAGLELRCEITTASRGEVGLRVVERIRHPAPAANVTLFQAIPKGGTMEWIVEKATELGATRVVPLLTERTVVHLAQRDTATKQARWERTALEAVKQCGNPWLTVIAAPVALADALAQARGTELALVASLQPGTRPPRACFAEFQSRHGRAPKSVALWVGPEGDFTAAEYALIAQAGAQPVTLGERVLRSETAAIAGLAILLHELNTAGVRTQP
jgi:16S rRNA (uracil1498-N3)-methyltransferase